MKKLISWSGFAIFAVIVLSVGWVLSFLTDMNFWVAGIIIAVAVILNGVFAALEKNDR